MEHLARQDRTMTAPTVLIVLIVRPSARPALARHRASAPGVPRYEPC